VRDAVIASLGDVLAAGDEGAAGIDALHGRGAGNGLKLRG
jgi:hypothetical protein